NVQPRSLRQCDLDIDVSTAKQRHAALGPGDPELAVVEVDARVFGRPDVRTARLVAGPHRDDGVVAVSGDEAHRTAAGFDPDVDRHEGFICGHSWSPCCPGWCQRTQPVTRRPPPRPEWLDPRWPPG